jgi:hypothetical protein
MVGKTSQPRSRCVAQIRALEKRCRQSFLPSMLCRSALPFSHAPSADSPGCRSLRAGARFLGHRSFPTPVSLSPGCHIIYRGVGFSLGSRQRMDHGPSAFQMVELAVVWRKRGPTSEELVLANVLSSECFTLPFEQLRYLCESFLRCHGWTAGRTHPKQSCRSPTLPFCES